MDFLPTFPIDVTPLIAFGLVLIVGAIGGYATRWLSWFPSITGFMIVGFICGPSGIGILSQETITESRILIDIALALILYRLGLSLDIKLLRQSPELLLISLAESAATFGLVFYVLHLFKIPLVIAGLVAAITISSSPAVLLHVAHEVQAKGVVTESTKTLVALNNIISFVVFSVFSAALPTLHDIALSVFSITLPTLHYATGADWFTMVFQPLYRFSGALLMGCVLAVGLHLAIVKTRQAPQYKLALVIGTIMLTIGLTYELKLSTLFAPLVIGVVVKNLEREAIVSGIDFGAAFELFFIVLFVLSGAGLHLHELVEFAPAVLTLVLARCLTKTLTVVGMAALFKRPLHTGIASGLLLIPMAGLAIGLVLTSKSLFPYYAPTIAAIVMGSVTVFETIGPPIAALAFRIAGESGIDRVTSNNTVKTNTPDSIV